MRRDNNGKVRLHRKITKSASEQVYHLQHNRAIQHDAKISVEKL